MPLYDILNEFQKGSSHMAAVVKASRETNTNNILAAGGIGKCHEGKVMNHSSELTIPLLKSRSCEKEGNVKVSIDLPPKVENIQRNAAAKLGVPHLPDTIEDGEVIGIITLEDVFEELLQVTSNDLSSTNSIIL